MTLPDSLRLTTSHQPLLRKFVDRLQHPVAGPLIRASLRPQQTRLDERGDKVENRVFPFAHYDLSRFQAATAGEHRQLPEERLLLGPQKVVAPGDGIPHRPQPEWPVAAPASE